MTQCHWSERLLGAHSVKDPVQVTVNSGVNSWDSFSSTESGTKADDSYEVPSVDPGLQVRDTSHQTTPTVPNTRILALLSSGTYLFLSQYSSPLSINLLTAGGVRHVDCEELEDGGGLPAGDGGGSPPSNLGGCVGGPRPAHVDIIISVVLERETDGMDLVVLTDRP